MSELYSKIEAYLHQELSPAEMKAFERELESNSELKADFELHKSVQMAVDTQVRAESLETIKNLKSGSVPYTGLNDGNGTGSRKFLIPVLLGLILLGLTLLFMSKNSKVDKDELFLAYYTPPSMNIERGGANHSPIVRTFSINAHKMVGLEKYEAAEGKFRECSKGGNIEARECQWFEALCALKLGRGAAKEMFKEISLDSKNPYQDKAKEILKKM